MMIITEQSIKQAMEDFGMSSAEVRVVMLQRRLDSIEIGVAEKLRKKIRKLEKKLKCKTS